MKKLFLTQNKLTIFFVEKIVIISIIYTNKTESNTINFFLNFQKIKRN